MEQPLFFIALFFHLTSLVVGFGAVIVIDFVGVMWIFKKHSLASVTHVAKVTQVLVWVGWTGLVISGSVLITLKGYIDNLTWIKLFFVAMLGVNGIFLHYIKKRMESIDTGTPDKLTIFRITLASAISQIGWWGAMLIGFLHRHISHTINWPDRPFLVISAILLTIFAIALVGEITYRRYWKGDR